MLESSGIADRETVPLPIDADELGSPTQLADYAQEIAILTTKPGLDIPVPPVANIPLVDNVQAPFLYFDASPNFGFRNGICNVTLEALRYSASGDAVRSDRIAVAHLRMGIEAAVILKNVLEKVILMSHPSQGTVN